MKRPPNRLAPACADGYQRHAWPASKRREPRHAGEVRRCTHIDDNFKPCTASQVGCLGPPRAHSDLLWYWQQSRP